MNVTTDDGSNRRRTRTRAAWIAVAILVVGGLAWLIVWALGQSERGATTTPAFERYRSAWESAMAKASVDASFPPGPVDLGEVRSAGARSLDATFTAEELEALLAVYRFEAKLSGSTVSLGDPTIALADGRARFEGRIVIDGNAYGAAVDGPARWASGRVDIADRRATVVVEGIELGGERKAKALRAVEDYLSGLVRAAPGLVVRSATISEAGLHVTGTVPVRIGHPAPLADDGE